MTLRQSDVEAVLVGRRSVRAFDGKPIDEATLQWIIAMACHAPSAMNAQPWVFTVVRDQGLLARISAKAKDFLLAGGAPILGAPALRDRLADPAFDIFYRAPVLILISAVEAGAWAKEDCALAAQNLMLAAFAAGLGSCWIGFAQRWLETDEGRQTMGLSHAHVPVAPIIVGHPSAAVPPVTRARPKIRWIN